jgi:hypothetical protein
MEMDICEYDDLDDSYPHWFNCRFIFAQKYQFIFRGSCGISYYLVIGGNIHRNLCCENNQRFVIEESGVRSQEGRKKKEERMDLENYLFPFPI